MTGSDLGPVMGPSRVSAAELTAWFDSKRITGARPTVPVAELAQFFIEEGAREGVTGDVAFVQSMLETGWLRFPDHGQVRPEDNNFAGLGATDGGEGRNVAKFDHARLGVRAQIQHLRAYADPTTTCSNFATERQTPRCHLVVPKGRAPLWSQFGGGNWATDPNYASKLQTLYSDLLAHAGRH